MKCYKFSQGCDLCPLCHDFHGFSSLFFVSPRRSHSLHSNHDIISSFKLLIFYPLSYHFTFILSPRSHDEERTFIQAGQLQVEVKAVWSIGAIPVWAGWGVATAHHPLLLARDPNKETCQSPLIVGIQCPFL